MDSTLIFVLTAILASSVPATEAFIKLPSFLPEPKASTMIPKCEYENKTATCCSSLLNMTQTQLCASFRVNLNELNVISTVSFNNKTLAEKKVEVGKFCVPVGGTPITACIHFYWVEIGLGNGPEDFKSNICFQGSVSKFASVDFQCLRFEDGKFSRNSEHKPSNKVGTHCYPIPIDEANSDVCINFYWVEIGFVLYPDDMKCNICFQGTVTNLATVDFECLRYENGTFSRNSDHKPTRTGLINLEVRK